MNKSIILLLSLIFIMSQANDFIDGSGYDTWDKSLYQVTLTEGVVDTPNNTYFPDENFKFPLSLHQEISLGNTDNLIIQNDLSFFDDFSTDFPDLPTDPLGNMIEFQNDFPLIIYESDSESTNQSNYNIFYTAFNDKRQISLGYVNLIIDDTPTRFRQLQSLSYISDKIHLTTEQQIPENTLVLLDFVSDFDKTQIWIDGILCAEGEGVKLQPLSTFANGYVTAFSSFGMQESETWTSQFMYVFADTSNADSDLWWITSFGTTQQLQLGISNIAKWSYSLDESQINNFFGDQCLTRISDPFQGELSQIFGYNEFSPVWEDKRESWIECYNRDCKNYFTEYNFCGSEDLQRFVNCAVEIDACKGQWTEPKMAKCIHKCYNTINSPNSEFLYDYFDCQLFCKKTLHAGEIVSIIIASVAVFFSLLFWGFKFSGILKLDSNFAKVEIQKDINQQKQQQQPQNQQQQAEDKTGFIEGEIF